MSLSYDEENVMSLCYDEDNLMSLSYDEDNVISLCYSSIPSQPTGDNSVRPGTAVPPHVGFGQ
jgi:hypothetical protein